VPEALAQIERAFRDAPRPDPAIQEFVVSKLATLTESQRAAVIAFLEAVRELGDDYVADQADKALSYWA
jgi:hypothetical protein